MMIEVKNHSKYHFSFSSLAWPDRFFPFLFVVAEPQIKTGKSGLATRDYHFRAYNFQNFPGGHAPRPPRLSCYAAELPSATVVYFCYSQPGATSLVPL